MATSSSGRNCSSSRWKDRFRSGSLLGWSIDPDVSIRNTRFNGGRTSTSGNAPWIAICTSFVPAFHGVGPTDTVGRNGAVPSGAGCA